jgi:Na+-driven multidrug efflux pump
MIWPASVLHSRRAEYIDRMLIVRRLAHVALPILLSSLVSLFAPLINTAIVGRDQPVYLYVLGIFLPIVFLQLSINESLRVSAVAFSAQCAGNGNVALFRRRLGSLVVLGVAIYVPLAVCFWLTHDRLIDLYAVPVEHRSLTYGFIQLNLLVGALVVVSITMMSALYALGDVYRVTTVTIVGFVANVALTWCFVVLGHWGAYALVAATLVTAPTTILWAASRLAKRGVLRMPSAESATRVWGHWQEIARISLPVFSGYLVLFLNSVLFTRLLALFSPTEVAAFGVAYRVQNIVLMPAIAIGIGLAIHVNRMVAAHQADRAHDFITTALATCLAVFVCLAAIIFPARDALVGLIIGDPSVVASASLYLAYMAPAYVIEGPLLALLVFMEETGNGMRSLIFNALAFGIQLGGAFYLAQTFHSVELVYQFMALSTALAAPYILYEIVRSRRLNGEQLSAVSSRS